MPLSNRTPLRDGPFMLSPPPRRSRNRAILITLIAILCGAAYLFMTHSSQQQQSQLSRQLENLRQTHQAKQHTTAYRSGKSHRPSVKFTPQEELAAVSSFIASLPQNVLPSSIDPKEPIDPQLVLDFDTRSAQAAEEVKSMERDVWATNPVFVYSKVRIHILARF